jgi:LEA14-like dessication related protein
MKIEKKYLIAGGVIALVGVVGALLYNQYNKLIDYGLGFKKLKVNKLTPELWSFDIVMNFVNKSVFGFTLVEQDYDLYVNDVFISKMTDYTKTYVKPKGESFLNLNVKFDPKVIVQQLKTNYALMLLKPNQTKIRLDMKMGVSVLGIKIVIPYVYHDTLQGLIAYYLTPTTT